MSDIWSAPGTAAVKLVTALHPEVGVAIVVRVRMARVFAVHLAGSRPKRDSDRGTVSGTYDHRSEPSQMFAFAVSRGWFDRRGPCGAAQVHGTNAVDHDGQCCRGSTVAILGAHAGTICRRRSVSD